MQTVLKNEKYITFSIGFMIFDDFWYKFSALKLASKKQIFFDGLISDDEFSTESRN